MFVLSKIISNFENFLRYLKSNRMNRTFFPKIFAAAALLLMVNALSAKELVVEIKNFDSDRGTFTLKTYGEKPAFSHVDFYSKFGATSGNTYNQIPGNNEATLDLYGWEGCTIDSVTFAMRSNKEDGKVQAKVELYGYADGKSTATLYDSGIKDFNSPDWYGAWVRFSNQISVDITKEMAKKREITDDEYVTITVTGGKTAGKSVYLDRLTIYYTPAAGIETEKPLPYKFTQLGQTDALADGDICILVTGGHVGACEVDTTLTNPYLGTTAVGSYDAVYFPENNTFDYPALLFFEMKQKDAAWHMIDQYGDTLGCKGKGKMSLNSGVLTWNITLGASYDGHTIASTRESYGSIQYNSADPRFTTYTSSQSKVFLCRRGVQQSEVLPTSLTLPDTRTMDLCTDSVILQPTLLPATVTDTRVLWKSLNPEIATVRDGIVRPVAVGEAKIVCTSRVDNTLTATCTITVADCHVASVTIMDEKGKYALNAAEMYECSDETIVLTAAVEPSNAPVSDVTWQSTDITVVTVDNGKLKPVAAGTADVILTSVDGGKSDTCHVTILPCQIEKISFKYPETDQKFTLKDCGGSVDGKGERFQIYVTIEPDVMTVTKDDFLWSSSDEAVAKVYGDVTTLTQSICATVHAIAPGKATITIAAKHDPSIKVESEATVVSCETALGKTELTPIYAENGRIVAAGDYRIFTLTGIDVTAQNGQLNGVYIVKIGTTVQKIAVSSK